MARNIALLRETMAQIDAHPEDWEQGSWRCNTGMCFAGWAVTLGDHVWIDKPNGDFRDYLLATPGEGRTSNPTARMLRDGIAFEGEQVITASAQAEHDLGITSTEADILFRGSNSRETLRNMVQTLIDGGRLTYEGSY